MMSGIGTGEVDDQAIAIGGREVPGSVSLNARVAFVEPVCSRVQVWKWRSPQEHLAGDAIGVHVAQARVRLPGIRRIHDGCRISRPRFWFAVVLSYL